MKTFQIYTDGACKHNPGPGGWAALIRSASGESEYYGYEAETTNNRMELQAVIEALQNIPDEPCRLTIYTDSQYVKNGMSQWIHQWKKNGWRTKDKKPVKNADLWQRLDELVQKHQVDWQWIKGHSGHPENERVDELANRAIRESKKKTPKRQIVLDTETTGLDFKKDQIIEIGCVELIDRRFSGRNYHQYIRPDVQMNAEALAVHGISEEFLADKPRFAEIVDEFIDYIEGAELIIHNASFDVGFINAELQRLGEDYRVEEICTLLDTLQLAKKKHPGQRNSLDALCSRYGVDNSKRQKHGALLDAQILAEVYLSMTRQQHHLLAEVDHSAENIQSIQAQPIIKKAPLIVLHARPEELDAHRAYVQKHGLVDF